MLVRIRDTEACAPVINHIWDSVWVNRTDAVGGYADWILASAAAGDPTEQLGGLRARMQLMTAIVIQLMTDARLPEGMPAPSDDGDRRGWWGDTYKLDGEPAQGMGSLLWTLRRAALSADTAKLARYYCEQALQMLLDQGAAGSFGIKTAVDPRRGNLEITIAAFDRSGKPVGAPFAFDVVWTQQRNPARMTYTDRAR